ncbi:hypothetical protein G5C51_35945 [Streptomyces sp. A7024]|uniref:Uncharacterized protein n=1 Tax=Streptomyces coryli TaxID=1128680 RepID=A0A6G4UD51_9ACTN|nr:hypothetical protein [Streptomyces coryli]NGN69267.1 hypothetical protein [Streptomyces coryli]
MKKKSGPAVGDILAVPAANGEFHFAVVLAAEDAFGLPLGFLRGSYETQEWPPASAAAPDVRPHAVYTDDDAVRSGDWTVVAHEPALVPRFRPPEIYHAAGADADLMELMGESGSVGQFGMAETADGSTRQLDEAEARAIGLLDGSYDQVTLSGYLPGHLKALGL